MIRSYGFQCEEHSYTTEDGYINVLHRIPPRIDINGTKKNRSVFLQHGLLGTSADYVMGRPDKSLGYLLSSMGYDVWLGNARGNAYSRKHKTLTTDDAAYWRFSFDQMGQYDLPAAIRYIVDRQDEERKIYYIGHSMGTTMFWASFDANAEFMEQHVELMVGMGPVAYVGHMISPLRILAPFTKELQYLLKLLGVNEFAPSNVVTQLFEEIACDATMRQLEVCENVCFLITGFDAKQMNMTLLPIILGHEPGGTSTRTVVHFAQEVLSRRFCKYDFGSAELNKKHYNGSSKPPSYDLTAVKVPVALMWAKNDWLADPEDVKKFRPQLPNIIDDYKVPDDDFNHVDFLWALDAGKLVYQRLFSYLSIYD